MEMPERLHMLTWTWDAPPIAPLEYGSDLKAIGVTLLNDLTTRARVVGGAWTAYQRQGRGIMLLNLRTLTTGIFHMSYWRRDGFALFSGLPMGPEFLKETDGYEPSKQALVGLLGVDGPDDAGARFALITVTPPLPPPAAYAQESERLKAFEIEDPDPLH